MLQSFLLELLWRMQNRLLKKQNICANKKEEGFRKMLKLMQTEMTLGEKLEILSDAAKYDVSCTSGGTERKGDGE